ncbi:MAG: hypothetical protein ACI9JE_001937, partial [Candidatus Krumholzibacteriia bacterium]
MTWRARLAPNTNYWPKKRTKGRLISQEIEYVAGLAAVSPVEFGIETGAAGDGGEALSLHVEYLAEKTAGCPHLTGVESGV